jgi:hypothetical protein
MITKIESIWTEFQAVLVPGYQVASGQGKDPRFPGGTLNMQAPFFLERGMDLSIYHPGTLNMNIAPLHYTVLQSRLTLRQVKWHPVEQAEDFSFYDVRFHRADGSFLDGLIYYPHPDTKPRHFQNPQVLELLLPYIGPVKYGDSFRLAVRSYQISIDSLEAV